MMRTLGPWLRPLAGAGILAVLGWRYSTGAFVDAFRVIDVGSVLAALGIGLLTTVLSAWRWCLVARGLGLRLPLTTAVADYYRALFVNAVLPGGVLGDVHRAVRHGRGVGDVGRGVRAVVLERVAGQVVLIAAGVVVVCTRPAVAHGFVASRYPGAALVVLVVVAVLAVWAMWGRGASRWRRAVTTVVADARLGLLTRATGPGVVSLSVAVLAGHIAMFLVAARLVGLSAPVLRLVPLIVLALLAMSLPVNVGGWGPREAVSAWAFGAAGLGAAQGLTAAVVYGVLALVASLPGAGVLILRRGTSGVEDRHVRTERRDQSGEEVAAFPGRGQ